MPVRRLSLEEWFLAHQLRHIGRSHFHIPGFMTVDVTALAARWRQRGEAAPFTAIVVKALALAAVRLPEINRVYLRTLLGPRVIDFQRISVNLPVLIEDGRKSWLSAITVHDADRRSVTEIRDEIRAAKTRRIEDLRLTRIVARKPNNILWRSVLRGLHFLAYNMPRAFETRGGGLSVSSLLVARPRPGSPARPGAAWRTASFGPTAITLALSGLREESSGQVQLELGMGMDHLAMAGVTFARLADVLEELLGAREPDALANFD